jgi:ectoine hydroxylase-related dioxygenase (phytanoyl-CoA dioxygenase family)
MGEYLKTFFGHRTKRMTNLVAISATYRERYVDNDILHDYVSALLNESCDSYWLSASQLIEIHPGEIAQPLHRDMGNFPIFRQYGPGGPEVIINSLLALTDSTEESGATRVIPGSHKWDFDREFTPEMTVAATMRAGSALLFSGKLVHGGGANVTDDFRRRLVTTPFNPGYLVPEEAYPFAISLEEARTMSPRVQQLIGFRSFHQPRMQGGSLWQHNFIELSDHLGL